ncbi:MAG: hypothetical protein IT169_01225 [Bryobacterales bacterium]|nr:hypothetical protein [Bryobacterales bacterium]
MILALLCGLAVHHVPAAEWRKLRSAHFDIFTTQPQPVALQAVERLEMIRAAFAGLGGLPVSADRLTVILFSGFNEFGFYSPSHMVKAYFIRTFSQEAEENVIAVSDFNKDVDPVLYHEFAHYCSREAGGQLPLWLEEGLAAYYESLEFDGKRLTAGKPAPQYLKLLKSKTFRPIPLGDLFSMPYEGRRDHSWDDTNALYAQGWAVVHTLSTNPRFAPKFSQFLARMRKGETIQDSLSEIYGTTIAQLRGDVDEHIQNLDRLGTSINLTPSIQESDARDVPLETWEARLFLTKLLVSLRRPVEAERDFDALRKEFPKVPQIWEALGDFKYERGEKTMALRYYKTAVELGTENPLSVMRLAESGESRPEAMEHAVALLNASLQRNPRNHNLRLEAIEWAFQHKRYTQAAAWAGRYSESGDIRDFAMNFNAGYAHFRADNPKEAQLWLKRAIESTEDSTEKQRAGGVLDRVEIALARRQFADRIADEFSTGTNSAVSAARGGNPENATQQAATALPEAAGGRANDNIIDNERLDMTLTVFTRDRGGRVAEGVMHELRCLAAGAQLVILSGGKPVVVGIDEPNNILITRRGRHVANYDFRCGRQKPEKVRIGYVPAEASGRVGFLRILQFE